MTGTVTDNGVPVIMLQVAGGTWPGIIDTGFNGDLELPDDLRVSVNPRFIGRVSSLLASGQHIDEDVYLVEFPFALCESPRWVNLYGETPSEPYGRLHLASPIAS